LVNSLYWLILHQFIQTEKILENIPDAAAAVDWLHHIRMVAYTDCAGAEFTGSPGYPYPVLRPGNAGNDPACQFRVVQQYAA